MKPSIIFDTNILSADPFFKSTEMVRLKELCKSGRVKLYLPDIVIREFQTQQKDDIEKIATEYISKLKTKLNKSITLSEKSILEQSIQKASESLSLCISGIDSRIQSFIAEYKISVLHNVDKDLAKILNMYFDGDLPFENRKSRKDFPDGLIYLQMQQLIDENAFIVSNDKRLLSSFDTRCNKYDSLRELFNSNIFIEQTDVVLIQSKLNDRILSNILKSSSIQVLVKSELEKELTNISFQDSHIPDDNNNGTISGTPTIDEIEFDSSTLKQVSAGLYTINFECRFETLIEYLVFMADFWTLEPERVQHISVDEWNDHYYSAEEYVNIQCIGSIGVSLNMESLEDVENDNDLFDDAEISFSEIELSIIEDQK